MKWFLSARVGVRLAAAFGAFTLLLVGICAYSAFSARQLAGDLDATVDKDLARMALSNALDRDVSVVARASREVLLLDSAGPIRKQRELISRSLADTEKTFGQLGGIVGKDGDAQLSQLRTDKDAFAQAVAKYLQSVDAGNPEDARATLLTEVRPAQNAYETSLGALNESIMKRASERASAGRRLAESNSLVMVVLGVVGLVLSVGAGLLMTRSITRPLADAKAAALRIRDGDLSCRIDTDAKDEIGDLLNAMSEMQAHLRKVIEDVHVAARDVTASSEEISRANADLSSRTERSAVNLQQTASAMDQISSTVAGSTEKSREAAAVAAAARSAVIEGGQSMESLVGTMTRIAESSGRIKDIIAVIDSIAFQTNILALNAAVEAARAGEQGRGFAVVAGEVRSLAGRAAEAAKEIKVLIDDSAVKVETGTRTVSDVGDRIRAVVSQVVGVRQLIEEVAVASQEQENGISAINKSVNDLDESTQQNSALVEQLSSATESLRSNSHRLVDIVGFFRVATTSEKYGHGSRRPEESLT